MNFIPEIKAEESIPPEDKNATGVSATRHEFNLLCNAFFMEILLFILFVLKFYFYLLFCKGKSISINSLGITW